MPEIKCGFLTIGTCSLLTKIKTYLVINVIELLWQVACVLGAHSLRKLSNLLISPCVFFMPTADRFQGISGISVFPCRKERSKGYHASFATRNGSDFAFED